ncbi:PPE family protein PPE36 [Mycobacterium tuberculosis TKK_03_0118]|nr:PPE family protein PPE36 [Mycobacterium tuberculosis TKK_03_0118]
MPNFWALPPEINSTRIYLGPGSGPILAAAQGWNALASELEKTKVGLQSALDTLLESYRGQSSQALIQQTLPYVQWLTTTAEHAHKTAIQLTAAANAYEQARAAMVPPAMVRANRVQTTEGNQLVRAILHQDRRQGGRLRTDVVPRRASDGELLGSRARGDTVDVAF